MRITADATAVFFSPRPRLPDTRSAAVSPTVVHRTLMIQKKTVTSGTLLSICRAPERVKRGGAAVVALAMDGRVGVLLWTAPEPSRHGRRRSGRHASLDDPAGL